MSGVDALRASEERTRLALEAADMGTWATSPDLSDQEWDARTRVLLGHDPDEDVGFDSFLERVHPDDRDRVNAEIAAALGTAAGSLDTQYRVLGRNGGQHWVNVRGKLVADTVRPAQFVGTIRDMTPQKAAEERSELLANELNHRIKNTLAVVQSIVSQSLRRADTPEQAGEAIGERLAALGRAHDLLTQTSWSAAPLQAVVEAATRVGGRAAKRVEIEGPDVRLNPKAALAFSMAMHELATNAIKYGALSNEAAGWRSTGARLTAGWSWPGRRAADPRCAHRNGRGSAPA